MESHSYLDFARIYMMHQAQALFFTRAKSNARFIKGDLYATHTKIQSKDPVDSFGNHP